MKLKKNLFILFLLFVILFLNYPAYAFRFVVYGDSRGDGTVGNRSFNSPVLSYINSQIISLNPLPNFVCFLGDAVYQPTEGANNYLHDWHIFMTNTLNGIPYYVAMGNHDIAENSHTLFTLQTAYQNEFNNMPNNGPNDPAHPGIYDHLTYSFEYGTEKNRSLFVFLDSYTVKGSTDLDTHFYGDYELESNILISWFQALANSDAPHKFLLTHVPFFSPAGYAPFAEPLTKDTSNNSNNGLAATQIYYSCSDFDILFCAHVHLYSRWTLYPATSIKAPQIVTGSCGAPIVRTTFSPKVYPYYGYNFAVVDVEDENVIVHAYGVVDNGDGTFSTSLIDNVKINKR
jgi:hypothetical protein